jgi:hypothetical protein
MRGTTVEWRDGGHHTFEVVGDGTQLSGTRQVAGKRAQVTMSRAAAPSCGNPTR